MIDYGSLKVGDKLRIMEIYCGMGGGWKIGDILTITDLIHEWPAMVGRYVYACRADKPDFSVSTPLQYVELAEGKRRRRKAASVVVEEPVKRRRRRRKV